MYVYKHDINMIRKKNIHLSKSQMKGNNNIIP